MAGLSSGMSEMWWNANWHESDSARESLVLRRVTVATEPCTVCQASSIRSVVGTGVLCRYRVFASQVLMIVMTIGSAGPSSGQQGDVKDGQAAVEPDVLAGGSVDEAGQVVLDHAFEFKGRVLAPLAQLVHGQPGRFRDLRGRGVKGFEDVPDVRDFPGCFGVGQRLAVRDADGLALLGAHGPAEGFFHDGADEHGLTGRGGNVTVACFFIQAGGDVRDPGC